MGVALNTFEALLTTRLMQKIPEFLHKKWFKDPDNNTTQLDPFIAFLKEKIEGFERHNKNRRRLQLQVSGPAGIKWR